MRSPVFIIAAWLVGLLAGSALNWARDRLVRLAAEPVDRHPGTPRPLRLAAWAAVVSWRRRLPASGEGPSLALDLAVELMCSILVAAVYLRHGFSLTSLALAAICCYFLLVAEIDLRYRIVLNAMVFPAAALALAYHLIGPGHSALSSLLGGLFGFILFAGAAWLKPGGMGGGDIKLATMIGLAVGFPLALWALGLGIVVGGVAAIALVAAKRRGDEIIPYAPFLCLGAVVAFLYNPFPLIITLLR